MMMTPVTDSTPGGAIIFHTVPAWSSSAYFSRPNQTIAVFYNSYHTGGIPFCEISVLSFKQHIWL
jgi:hypothetical protein